MSDSPDPAAAACEAACLLWRHWQAGTVLDALPAGSRPMTRAAGYAVQAQLPFVAGRAVAGWKIAATSAAGQAHIAVKGPLAGRLLDGQLHADGAKVSLRGNRMRVAEPEFAFRFGLALPARAQGYGREDVLAAIASLHPSIEVPDSRFADFAAAGEAQLLADNACAHRFVLGPPAPPGWRALDLSTHVVRALVHPARSERWHREGSGAQVLGDPRDALTWLVNELSGLGLSLDAGAVVTTGTCLQPVAVSPGDAVAADFGALGRVSVQFTD